MWNRNQSHSADWLARFVAVLSVGLLVAGCSGLRFGSGAVAGEQFEFVLKPPSLTDTEVVAVANAQDDKVLSGTAKALASLATQAGQYEFVYWETTSAHCPVTMLNGSPDPMVLCSVQPVESEALMVAGGGASGGGWSSLRLQLSDQVDYVALTTTDGTEYRIEPFDGVGFAEWPSQRGSWSLVAYDGDGNAIAADNDGVEEADEDSG